MKTEYVWANAAVTVALALLAFQVSAQDTALSGFASGGNVDITGTDLKTVVYAPVCAGTPGPIFTCVWTCSAEINLRDRGLLDVDGRLELAWQVLIPEFIPGEGNEVTGTSRSFVLNDNIGISDGGPIVVSTTGGASSDLFGTSCDLPVYVMCLVKKISSADANFRVVDSSLSFVCTDASR